MDTIDNNVKSVQHFENSGSSKNNINTTESSLGSFDEMAAINNSNSNDSSSSSFLKLYDYQIVQMQHEYELLLEDKIIVEKLLDNQMKIFTKYKNLSNEKSLIQQFNALNQELDYVQTQLFKVNQTLNQTISEKCRQELLQSSQNTQQNQEQNVNNKANLYRASLVAVGTSSSSSGSSCGSSSTSGSVNGDTSSLLNELHPPKWKSSSTSQQSPLIQNKNKTLVSSVSQSISIDNLAAAAAVPNTSIKHTIQDQPKVTYQSHFNHQPVRNANQAQPNYFSYHQEHLNVKKMSEISRSIDNVYSPNDNYSNNNNNSSGAFNSVKKVVSNEQQDSSLNSSEKEIEIKFQPVNFTNSRPKQLTMNQNTNNTENSNNNFMMSSSQMSSSQINVCPNSAFVPKNQSTCSSNNNNNNHSNFKRDLIAEKKRSSIGKNSLNYVS
jgi:hypothetical protein